MLQSKPEKLLRGFALAVLLTLSTPILVLTSATAFGQGFPQDNVSTGGPTPAGGLEAGISALAVHHQVVPPTINLTTPDPECDLDYVPHTSRQMAIRYALSNSFGFGGTNAALLFKRYEFA